jgi:FeS assembly SUF system protein
MDTLEIEEAIAEILRTVHDPEIPVNIIELGLVYKIEVSEAGFAQITMTLTAPACPVAGDIIREVDEKVRTVAGVTDANVMLTFDPPWNREMMSEEAKLELGFL